MLFSKKKKKNYLHSISGILRTQFQQSHIINSKILGTENVIFAFLYVSHWPATLLTVPGSKKSTVIMPRRIIINILDLSFILDCGQVTEQLKM